ncbi:hypothetical protein GCM10011490_14810 [Pseudoclavibacter endophyticus]|uniref:Putative pterin-4-alpha-carbinolamine dehydratase n=1 Tax=Pseudoclavibacter endophyticus TaxID=1778590 RepID=A0A6H9WE21_9MICO|nr:4a-hydroxytetrahydrobiopterin dehydratase [Pseudoclavibacter endophyticus]KAB1649129.1 4a-hydroxytetrahydrobiopterin dehydratase [Pseudoclavibacter endophyticus]GGA65168.1 hypothetical protein GCM10011490_14810 [Pseudoclavibacter endophyticus]
MNELLNRADASAGAPDWRLLGEELHLAVNAGDFVSAIDFVRAVADIAESQQHHPDIDIRYHRVFLAVKSHDVGGLTERDLRFATAVANEARARGHSMSPNSLTAVDVGIDCADPENIAPFWAAILGAKVTDDHEIVNPHGRAMRVWFQVTDSPSRDRGRTHLDVMVPHDRAEARIQAALDAGGRVVDDSAAPAFVVLADSDGNVACVCTWQGRDEHEAAERPD